MSSLSAVESKLPPGFRFHPKDEELICDYLMKWVMCCPLQFPFLIQVDLNKCEPWDIPECACVGGKEWYFYSQRDRKYATGFRKNRATNSGHWKATGKDRPITSKGNLIVGARKTLVFYQGRAPKGQKTDWVMHEFNLQDWPGPNLASHFVDEDWVLCRVFNKNQISSSSSSSPSTQTKQEVPNFDFHTKPTSSFSSEPARKIELEIGNDDQHHHDDHKQVPCFSIDHTTRHTNAYYNLSQELEKESNFEDFGLICESYHNYPPPLCDADHHRSMHFDFNDKKVVTEGFSADGFLSEVGISSFWDH